MSYFAESAYENILSKVTRLRDKDTNQRRIIVTTNNLPADVVLDLAKALDAFAVHDENVVLILKAAAVLGQQWRTSDPATYEELRRRGWLDDSGNLTGYRNAPPPDERHKVGLVVLVGADRVTDSSSLADFYRCDTLTVWREQMQESFATWIRQRLDAALVGYDDRTVKNLDTVLIALKDQGCADLFQISTLLRELPLEAHGAQDGRDAERLLLSGLQSLNLPSFIGFKFSARRRLSPYIEAAVRFFRYDPFLEDRTRVSAIKTIDALRQQAWPDIEDNRLFAAEERGIFVDDATFIQAVRDFVEREDVAARESLMHADFIAVHDKILRFKIKTERQPRASRTKLSGGPVEMLLTSLWLTFRDCRHERPNANGSELAQLVILGEQFRHDSESLVEGTAAAELQQQAKEYLDLLVGGVDLFFTENYLDLSEMGCDISVDVQLSHDEVSCTHARTAEPSLEFRVEFHFSDADKFVRQFAWRLPETHTFRMSAELLALAASTIDRSPSSRCLPAFHIGYHEELMRAKDDDETRRVLLHALRDVSAHCTDLLTPEWREQDDALLPYLYTLATQYRRCVEIAAWDGLHSIFHKIDDEAISPWDLLRREYEAAAKAFLGEDQQCRNSPLGALLMRAFLIVSARESSNHSWVADTFEPSAVATVLHPSVLDMLSAHIAYLFACFNYVVPLEWQKEQATRAFHPSKWQDYLDLAAIHMPLGGLIVDENHIVDTHIVGRELIHRVGSPTSEEATLSTRLLLRYEGFDDEDIADATLFAETRESRLLQNILNDYLATHPHARDGFSLAVYRNEDLQPVVAAVHAFLLSLATGPEPILNDKRQRPYVVAITVFTEAGEDAGIARWVQEWKERWDAAETEDKYALYRLCRFSIAHRVVPRQDKDHKTFARMIRDGLDVDVAVLYDFIGAGLKGNDFLSVTPYNVLARTLKFPIIEKPFCTVDDPQLRLRRARIISNPQFRTASLHTEIMARLKNPNTPIGHEHVLVGFGDFAPWQEAIDELHQHTEWVVCIDPSIDDMLIKTRRDSHAKEREIIGFGSGVGLHGELNFTVSTEHFNLSDIRFRLERAIKELYPGWDPNALNAIAESVIRESQNLSGLSLVRATGVGTYLHDFMAYALTSKMLQPQPDLLCSHLITLDAYQHWFDGEDRERPDLLWLTARLDGDRIALDLHLIECKLAQRNYAHVDKAVRQIHNGLATLVPAFVPRPKDGSDDSRPDQRYWWLQLHRLIASKTRISRQRQSPIMAALERLADGDYDVSWHAAVVAFWTDNTDSNLMRVRTESHQLADDHSVPFDIYAVGSEAVRGLCMGDTGVQLTWEATPSTVTPEPLTATITTSDQPDQFDTTPVPSLIPQHVQPEPTDKETVPHPPEVTRQIPERVLLGKAVPSGREVFWEFGHSGLANRHLLVFGTSGMGKTYAIQCLLCEMGKLNQNSLVMDYTSGFTPRQLEHVTKRMLNPKQHVVQQAPLPISPFQLQQQELDEGIDVAETAVAASKRIAGTFCQVYDTLGDQQYSVLLDAVIALIQTQKERATLDGLLEILESFVNDGHHDKQKVLTTISKLKPFVLDRPFGADASGLDWRGLFTDETYRCHVFQFAGMDAISARLLIEFSLWDLNAFVRGSGNKNLPKVVVLDEAQNLDLTEGSPVSKYLTEGRKFGLSLILATQTMKNLHGDKLSRLFQAGHKLFFRPADTELQEHAKLLVQSVGGAPQEWIKDLATLEKGQCYSVGPSLNMATGRLETKAFRISVSSLEERFGHV